MHKGTACFRAISLGDAIRISSVSPSHRVRRSVMDFMELAAVVERGCPFTVLHTWSLVSAVRCMHAKRNPSRTLPNKLQPPLMSRGALRALVRW